MKFSKYHNRGAYHWRKYEDKNTKYRRHADRVKEWIQERNVLDIGAGDGKITHLLGIRGVDNEPEAVRLAQEMGADVILADAYNLPYQDEEFEAVFMGDTLEHCEFPEKALQEARRVLRNYLYIASPEKETTNDKYHYNEWTPRELKDLVEKAGFVLEGEILEVPRDKRIYGKFRKLSENKLSTLDYILQKYKLDPQALLPIEIPNVGKDDLAKLLHELDFKIGVEVGVAGGKYSVKLCEANPQMKLYGVDPWLYYENYSDFSDEKLDSLYKLAKERLSGFPNYEIIKDYSMKALNRFEDNSLDFVYIDANHDEPFVSEDIKEWSKKVRSGGIVSGHDYFKRKNVGDKRKYSVIKATQKYAKDNDIKPWFVLGLSEKIPGLVRDVSRSWFWVKP